jgi:hypothetical protein
LLKKKTRKKGLIINPNKSKDLDVYIDADFCGNWDSNTPNLDRDMAQSRHGYIIMNKGCPVIWKS